MLQVGFYLVFVAGWRARFDWIGFLFVRLVLDWE